MNLRPDPRQSPQEVLELMRARKRFIAGVMKDISKRPPTELERKWMAGKGVIITGLLRE